MLLPILALFPSLISGLCRGGFDVYFVYDRSSSGGDNFKNYMIPFTRAVTDNFNDAAVQVSLIWFADQAHMALELTSNHTALDHALQDLEADHLKLQGTSIGSGLALIQPQATTAFKLVFLISDGCELDVFRPMTSENVARLRSQGVEIFVVYMPPPGWENGTCPDYLQTSVASAPLESHWFQLQESSQLSQREFVEHVMTQSCLEVSAISPASVCNSTRRTLHITGKGFSLSDNLSHFMCKFSAPPCLDDPSWRDPSGNPCAAYRGYRCSSFSATVASRCPQTCRTTCATISCVDDPAIDCARKVANGGCNADFSSCPRSCQKCGLAKAFVVNDTDLFCQSPPLGRVGFVSFELTRNGITYSQGSLGVSTYSDCAYEAPDLPLVNLTDLTGLAIQAIEPLPQFDRARDTSVMVGLEVKNTGKLALDGPIMIYSDISVGRRLLQVQGSVCSRRILTAGGAVLCNISRPISSTEIAAGKLSVRVWAEAKFGAESIRSADRDLTIFAANTIAPSLRTSPPSLATVQVLPFSEAPSPYPTVTPTVNASVTPPSVAVKAASISIVATCQTWWQPLECVPWWVWLILGLAVLSILCCVFWVVRYFAKRPPPPTKAPNTRGSNSAETTQVYTIGLPKDDKAAAPATENPVVHLLVQDSGETNSEDALVQVTYTDSETPEPPQAALDASSKAVPVSSAYSPAPAPFSASTQLPPALATESSATHLKGRKAAASPTNKHGAVPDPPTVSPVPHPPVLSAPSNTLLRSVPPRVPRRPSHPPNLQEASSEKLTEMPAHRREDSSSSSAPVGPVAMHVRQESASVSLPLHSSSDQPGGPSRRGSDAFSPRGSVAAEDESLSKKGSPERQGDKGRFPPLPNHI